MIFSFGDAFILLKRLKSLRTQGHARNRGRFPDRSRKEKTVWCRVHTTLENSTFKVGGAWPTAAMERPRFEQYLPCVRALDLHRFKDRGGTRQFCQSSRSGWLNAQE